MSEMKHKQVIVVRTDLEMSGGKACVQVAHASLCAAEVAKSKQQKWHKEWKEEGQRKVVVCAGSEEELLELYEKARKAKLPCSLISDAGLTELEPGTKTAAAIGPAPEEEVDKITRHLKLF